MKEVKVKNITIGNKNPLVLLAGPCVIEDEKGTLKIAEEIKKITDELKVPYIFKASYDKGNRASHKSYSGPGLKKGLEILQKIKNEFDLPVVSDVQCKYEVKDLKDVLDIIQIPAYLCQQTSLALEVAKTGKPVNIKKGQFLSPQSMKSLAEKVESTGNNQILFTERGTTFGYNNLVCDYRGLTIMRELGYPIVFDVTHIVRNPGFPSSDPRGGNPEFIFPLSRAAAACKIDAIFIETHPCPEKAMCDASSMLPLSRLKELLKQIIEIDTIAKRYI
ncbi:MAG: 3-deoxy-8-phosphooctulonate synthase [Candidatus Firestonebacteria bacterium]|nr:3-deoxy-8-phosphooctulonate synthase [Candidatus Firestonebacteria bacterium]